MASLEELAQLIAIGQAQKEAIAASDPYLKVKQAPDLVSQLLLQSAANPQYSTKDKIVGGLLTGLASGALGNLSEDYQGRARDDYTSVLASSLLGQSVERPQTLTPSIFRDAKDAASIFKIRSNLSLADDTNKQNLEDRKIIISELAKADTPQRQQRILAAGKALGVIPQEMSLDPQGAEPIAIPASELAPMGPDLGVPSLQDIEDVAFQRKLEQGMPAIQAATSARADAEDRRSRSKALITDKLKEDADTIATTEDIIRKGEEGIAKAGVTGSKLASIAEKGTAWVSDLLGGGVFPEAERQAAGDSNLNLTQNLGAMLNRIKGSGALSDFESKALFDTAMSPTKTKSQNEAILRSYKNGLSIMKDHNAFLNYFINQTGGNPDQAQTLWEVYKQNNPIVVQNEQGDFVVNEARTPWQKFDFKKGYNEFIKGNVPNPTTTPSTSTVPQVGSSFNGEKVLSVRKIK